jgi:CheY-like chemotaxis protein
MPDDQQRCIEAGASDYMAKPIDVDRLLSLVRVWMPR